MWIYSCICHVSFFVVIVFEDCDYGDYICIFLVNVVFSPVQHALFNTNGRCRLRIYITYYL